MKITREIALLFEKGLAALSEGQHASAAEIFTGVLARVPGFATGHNALGLALAGLERAEDALVSYEAASRADPSFSAPYINRATLLRGLGQLEAALASLDKAVALEPQDPAGHNNRGSLLMEMGRPAEAVASFDRVLALNPSFPYVPGLRLINKAYVCDWNAIDQELAELEAKILHGEAVTPPWPLLALIDSPQLQRKVAEAWVAAQLKPATSMSWRAFVLWAKRYAGPPMSVAGKGHP